MDDIALIKRITEQDAQALQTLYERHAPVLLAMGYRVLHDRQLAEDVLNEVFLELWKAPEKYDADRSSPRTYLVLVMRRRAIDKLRSRKAGVDTVAFDGRWHQPGTSPSAGPSDTLADAEERQRLRDVLDELPEEQRIAIEMSFFGGKTNVEIAEETGQPLGTIKGRIRLGLIRLRDRLRTIGVKGGRDE